MFIIFAFCLYKYLAYMYLEVLDGIIRWYKIHKIKSIGSG